MFRSVQTVKDVAVGILAEFFAENFAAVVLRILFVIKGFCPDHTDERVAVTTIQCCSGETAVIIIEIHQYRQFGIGGNGDFRAVVDRLLPRGDGRIGHVFIRHRDFQTAAVPEDCTDGTTFQTVEHPELFGHIRGEQFRTGTRGTSLVVPAGTENDLRFFVFVLLKETVSGNHGVMGNGGTSPEIVIGQQESLKGDPVIFPDKPFRHTGIEDLCIFRIGATENEAGIEGQLCGGNFHICPEMPAENTQRVRAFFQFDFVCTERPVVQIAAVGTGTEKFAVQRCFETIVC